MNQSTSQSTRHNSERESLAASIHYHLDKYFTAHQDTTPEPGLYKTIMHEAEKITIKTTLEFCDNNQSKAAYILGINRNTLRKKIEQFNLI